MAFLDPQYDTRLVVVSILIATLASYVALDLAQRVRSNDRQVALTWGIVGSLALGTGIWAMHFVGMMAFSLPIELGYRLGMTLLSWAAAVAVSGVALRVASHGRLGLARLSTGALLMGGGVCAMHYIGMAALDLVPGIVWNPWLVAVSVTVAVAASAAALMIFFWLRRVASGAQGHAGQASCYQAVASVVMGLAIAGTHYTGMAAASFPAGSVCLSADALSGNSLGSSIILASAALLALTLFTSTLDGRLRGRTARLAASLQIANDELTAANRELKAIAFRDPLTGLPNRLLFEDRLQHAVARADGAGARLAVLFIDLDGFKPINDSLGRHQGDQVLREAAVRLRALAHDHDDVARVGGDEFVLILEGLEGSADDCTALARRIVERLGEPYRVGERQFSISASVGIVSYPDDGAADKLLAHAGAAMYAAKRAGGGTWARFEPHMASSSLEQLSLQSDLRQAVERGQLQLHYQPKVDARSGRPTGVEALLRWQHPQRGPVSPALFIPIAERFGLIGALGDWVIDEACRQMGAWAAAGQARRVAINLSVHQLRQDDLAGRIERTLQRHGLDPADLLCEITESAAMDDLRNSRRAFDELLRIGVFLSIDDFGTGHSSLSYLRRLPARQLKIDRSFVKDLESSADARAIVQAVLGMAHALGLRVVAEGVETAGQRDTLVQLGCDELQGYFFARPMPADALPAWEAGRSAQRLTHEVEPVLTEEHRATDKAGRRAEHAA